RVLAEAGIHVEAREDLSRFHVPGGQRFQRLETTIPGDAPSAAALLAAGIAASIPLVLHDADPMGEEMQNLIGAFRALDAPVEVLNDGTVQLGAGQLRGARIDGDL